MACSITGCRRLDTRVVMLAPRHRAWGNRVSREAFALAEAGYCVRVLARTAEKQVERGVFFVPAPGGANRIGAFLQTLNVLRWAMRERADIYHLHNPSMLLVGFLLKAFGKCVVYDTHEDFSRRLQLRNWIPRSLRGPAGFVVSRAERMLGRVADATLVTQKQQVQEFGGRARLLRNAPLIDPAVRERVEALCPATPEQRTDFRLLYVGSLTRARGGMNLLDALRRLNDRGVVTRLWLIGPDDDGVVDDLRRHAAWKYVDYLGLKQQEEAFAYMSCADVGLAVLPNVGDHADALPSKLFEYMAWGLPFVASDFPVWRSFVGETAGHWVQPEDPEQLADTLAAMLKDPEAKHSFAEGGRAFICSFNWDNESQVLLDVYKTICRKACLGSKA